MTKPSEQDLERLRVRIAELCGWSQFARWEGHLLATNPSGNMDRQVPDYTRDLNAVHEAEEMLYSDGVLRMSEELEKFRQDAVKRDSKTLAQYRCWHAESWQRCIALDRTLSEDPLL